MSSPVDLGWILDSSVHVPVAWISWGGFLVAAVLSLFLYPLLSASKMPKLPIALEDEIPSEKERIQKYLTDTRSLLTSGYTQVCDRQDSATMAVSLTLQQFKNQIFGINTTEGLPQAHTARLISKPMADCVTRNKHRPSSSIFG